MEMSTLRKVYTIGSSLLWLVSGVLLMLHAMLSIGLEGYLCVVGDCPIRRFVMGLSMFITSIVGLRFVRNPSIEMCVAHSICLALTMGIIVLSQEADMSEGSDL